MSNKDLSCDAVTGNNTCGVIRRYPVYHLDAVEIWNGPNSMKEGIVIESDIEVQKKTSLFDKNLLKSGSSEETILKVLLAEECKLRDVISLKSSKLTRLFLRKKLAISGDKSYERPSWTNPYVLIDCDIQDSVEQVMSSLDLENAEVILTYGPDIDLKRIHFFYNFVTMAKDQANLEVLRIFAEHIVKWNILDTEGSRLIEQEIFQKANKDVLRIFLECRLDLHIEKRVGHNVLAALFGHPKTKIGTLKRKKRFNVNAAGCNSFTALHYAMKNKNVKKVKFLLDRGADPNSWTKNYLTPLMLTLWEPTVNPVENKKCAELLLQYGGDPFMVKPDNGIGFYRCMYARRASYTRRFPAFAPVEYLMELALAYSCLLDAAGPRILRSPALDLVITDQELRKQYRKCSLEFYKKRKQEIRRLKEHEISKGLTMFTVASKTGEHLIQLVKKEDEKIIAVFLDEYIRDKTIHTHYVNAIREHMRQYRKLVAHKNRAMLVLSVNAEILAPYYVVLKKIVDYLNYKDLLMFQ